ncbi:hypothetical protein PIIN_04783 [Serendipita indica DSM 11827]|uniref:F-box domain-containing protein n=1 Tax=Serendipita indica (strain DSM 11827) TaxID=1109443 RepID=G4THQ5_SERID|nr:hypothetical protein PIIN_04783 [Serendipita indica DSM 11827]
MEATEEPLHYLSLLPQEIWRQILSEVYPPILRVVCESLDADLDYPRMVFNLQSQRAKLRLICKRLEPIAVEVLFKEIAIDPSTWCLQSLFDTIRCITGFGGSPFVYTASAFIQLDCRGNASKIGKVDVDYLQQLHKYCPKIRLMVLNVVFDHTFQMHFDWIKGVETLMIRTHHIESGNLHRISSQVHGLRRLILDTLTFNLVKPVTVADLTCLDLRCSLVKGFGFLSVSKIHQINTIFDPVNLVEHLALFEANGPHLEHLALRSGILSRGLTNVGPLVKGMANVLRLCPRLKVLEVEGQFISSEHPQPALLSIHTLVLCFHNPKRDIIPALCYWGFGSKSEMPTTVTTLVIKMRIGRLSEHGVRNLALSAVDAHFTRLGITFTMKPVRYEQFMGIHISI